VSHAILRDPEGAITSFDAPGADTATGQLLQHDNDAGMIPGVSNP
jgi:hypothetical protein